MFFSLKTEQEEEKKPANRGGARKNNYEGPNYKLEGAKKKI